MSDLDNFSNSSIDSDIPPIIRPILSKYKINNNNINTITLDKTLGKGGFGTVYLCYDENKQELAVKCIKSESFGIPSLIEASIMAVIQHPNLAKALKIHCTPQKLYIIQELAVSDLRVYRQNNYVSDQEIISWIHMIGQGIQCLHRNDVIHGDIKANNILIYSDKTVKLTDFTLSTDKNWTNEYRCCTPTHRPLEVWMGKKWDFKVDIWALGCTIFEMVYGKNLFVPQNTTESINALIDWNNYLPMKYKSTVTVSYHQDIFHYTFSLPDSFDTSNTFNKLILSMLLISPENRPSIDEILNMELFSECTVVPSMNINTPVNYLPRSTEVKIRKTLKTVLSNKITIDVAYNLYIRLTGLINVDDKIKIITCAWIAHKMVERQNIPMDRLSHELHEILNMERKICHYLSFRLYCKNSQVIIKNK